MPTQISLVDAHQSQNQTTKNRHQKWLALLLQLLSNAPVSLAPLGSADLEETLEAAQRQHLLNVNAPDSGMQVRCLTLTVQ